MSGGPVLIGIPGTELDPRSRAWLEHPAVGGVVLFSRNFVDRAQLQALVESIRDATEPRPLVCIDQEGGRVQRLREGFTRLPPLGVLGRLYAGDPVKAVDMAYRHGRVMSMEMLASGIDLSFAPVLDLDRGSRVIGDRAFSPSPDVVTELGRAYLAGMRDAGMRSCGKHFPGHGSVEADSHTDDVTDPRALEDIEASDLLPFRALRDDLDALMIAHVVYPEVDDRPAGYSSTWLRAILRDGLGFRGLAVSDDLCMHAARVAGGLAERATACLDAGCDLVLVCHPNEVEELLSGGSAPVRDAASALARLYGRPTVGREQLQAVVAEGIREWGHWQRSLEALGDQSWT
ncbi:MAG: beta-N-acetylhexosaminidase [Xanthomonadales bacterium]